MACRERACTGDDMSEVDLDLFGAQPFLLVACLYTVFITALLTSLINSMNVEKQAKLTKIKEGIDWTCDVCSYTVNWMQIRSSWL